MKKKMEFSKKIVVWSMVTTTIFLIISTIGFYITPDHATPTELVNMVGLIITGVIVSYAGKSGVENYQKIKNNNTEREGE